MVGIIDLSSLLISSCFGEPTSSVAFLTIGSKDLWSDSVVAFLSYRCTGWIG